MVIMEPLSPQGAIDRRRLFLGLGLWGLAVLLAAGSGLLSALPPLMLGPMIVAGMLLPVLLYAVSPGMRRAIGSIGLRRLTAFQSWRVAATPVFLWYGAHDLLPAEFARGAAWGDLAAGLIGLAVALLPPHRGRYWAAHLFGLLDLVNAIATGVAFTLAGDPRMAAIGTLPLALIPLFGVGVTGASHILAFDLLRRGQGRPALV